MQGFCFEDKMDIKLKIENSEIAEKACYFAQNMNGVESAVFDGGEITVKLSPNGSENVVKSAVEGYIEAMGGKIDEASPENKSSRLKFVCRIVITVLLAVIGAVLEHKGTETTPLFVFIAAYIIISWDAFLSIAEKLKEKRRPRIAETALCIVSAVMFVMGWYLPAVAVMLIGQLSCRFNDYL